MSQCSFWLRGLKLKIYGFKYRQYRYGDGGLKRSFRAFEAEGFLRFDGCDFDARDVSFNTLSQRSSSSNSASIWFELMASFPASDYFPLKFLTNSSADFVCDCGFANCHLICSKLTA